MKWDIFFRNTTNNNVDHIHYRWLYLLFGILYLLWNLFFCSIWPPVFYLQQWKSRKSQENRLRITSKEHQFLQRSFSKIMISVACVCLSAHREGPLYRALTPRSLCKGPQSYLLPMYSTHTCSNSFSLDLNFFIIKHVRSGNWLLASYWNAYFFYIFVLFFFTYSCKRNFLSLLFLKVSFYVVSMEWMIMFFPHRTYFETKYYTNHWIVLFFINLQTIGVYICPRIWCWKKTIQDVDLLDTLLPLGKLRES